MHKKKKKKFSLTNHIPSFSSQRFYYNKKTAIASSYLFLSPLQIHKILIGLSQFGIAVCLIISSSFLNFTGSIVSFSVGRIFLIILESCLQLVFSTTLIKEHTYYKGNIIISKIHSCNALISEYYILMHLIDTRASLKDYVLDLMVLALCSVPF